MERCQYQVDFNDTALMDICFDLMEDISHLMPHHTLQWTVTQYIDFHLMLSGSAFTVGIADQDILIKYFMSWHAHLTRALSHYGRHANK